MTDPLANAQRIILNDPSLAEPLLDLLLWASGGNVRNGEDFVEIQELLYSKTNAYCEARDRYVKSRAA